MVTTVFLLLVFAVCRCQNVLSETCYQTSGTCDSQDSSKLGGTWYFDKCFQHPNDADVYLMGTCNKTHFFERRWTGFSKASSCVGTANTTKLFNIGQCLALACGESSSYSHCRAKCDPRPVPPVHSGAVKGVVLMLLVVFALLI